REQARALCLPDQNNTLWTTGFQKAAPLQPLAATDGPAAQDRIVTSHAEAVLPMLIDMEFHRYARFAAGQRKEQTVFARNHTVLGRGYQEGRRSFRGDLLLIGHQCD